MPVPTDVTEAEVDAAFYKSYGEGSAGGTEPALAGAGGVGRRPLTLEAKDAAYRECWMETRRLLRLDKGLCPVPPGSPPGAAVMCCVTKKKGDSPKFEPALWNDGGAIQTSTNCYAYAMNSRTGHVAGGKPQPGDVSVTANSSPYGCASTTAAVVADGASTGDIVKAPRCPYNQQRKRAPPDKAGYYLVALVVTSKPDGYDAADNVIYGNDYHWYRQDEDGSWSHKPGHAKAGCVDAVGNPIDNPETASRRTSYPAKWVPAVKRSVPYVIDYDNFCGYFYVKKGGATV